MNERHVSLACRKTSEVTCVRNGFGACVRLSFRSQHLPLDACVRLNPNFQALDPLEGGIQGSSHPYRKRGRNEGIKEANEWWIEFSSKLWGARSRLYRRRFWQVNTRWKALDEIYKIYMLLHRWYLKISAKTRHHFFREWIMNFQRFCVKFCIFSGDFCAIFMKFCPDFATNSRKEWRVPL